MLSINIENVDERTVSLLRQRATEQGITLEVFVLQLLRHVAEEETLKSGKKIHHDLDGLAGTWSEEEAHEFMQAISDFEKIDEEMWK